MKEYEMTTSTRNAETAEPVTDIDGSELAIGDVVQVLLPETAPQRGTVWNLAPLTVFGWDAENHERSSDQVRRLGAATDAQRVLNLVELSAMEWGTDNGTEYAVKAVRLLRNSDALQSLLADLAHGRISR